MQKFRLFIKRAFDISVSFLLILILILIPVLVVIPIAIKLSSRGPAIFTQERVGKDGKPFKIYKFRTMLLMEDRIDKNGNTMVPNDSITKVGKILRKTSLDELPQLFNILNGTMSFVGPRPMIPTQVAKISDSDKRRHLMRPGVTGWAQVNGRNSLTWTEKLNYDIYYVDHFTLKLDIIIFFKTVKTVLMHTGIEYVHEMGNTKTDNKDKK